MPKKNEFIKFSAERERLLAAGYWQDSSITIDKVLIESHSCPQCRQYLAYRGFADIARYLAFGVCESCDLAHRFWTENTTIAGFKKKFSSPAKAG